MQGYFVNLFSAVSQLLNVMLFNGNPNESICGRCYRESRMGAMRVLDFVFAPVSKGTHCRGAYNQDRTWAQMACLWPARIQKSEY